MSRRSSKTALLRRLREFEARGVRATRRSLEGQLGEEFVERLEATFGSVRAARREAGLGGGQKYDSRAAIREGLRRLHERGVRLVPKELVACGEARLVSAIYRHYANFPAALRAAGLAKASPQPRKRSVDLAEAREHVLARARELGRAPPQRRLDRPCVRRLREEYGTWDDVLDALGLERGLKPNQRWTRDSILERLRELDAAGLHLSHVYLRAAGHSDVLMAGQRHFGSFAAAREQAGIEFRPRWGVSVDHLSPADVRRARRRFARGGVSQSELATDFGVSPQVMFRLLRHELMPDAGGPKLSRQARRRAGRLAPKTKAMIRRRYATGRYTQSELAREYGVARQTLQSILKGGGGR